MDCSPPTPTNQAVEVGRDGMASGRRDSIPVGLAELDRPVANLVVAECVHPANSHQDSATDYSRPAPTNLAEAEHLDHMATHLLDSMLVGVAELGRPVASLEEVVYMAVLVLAVGMLPSERGWSCWW